MAGGIFVFCVCNFKCTSQLAQPIPRLRPNWTSQDPTGWPGHVAVTSRLCLLKTYQGYGLAMGKWNEESWVNNKQMPAMMILQLSSWTLLSSHSSTVLVNFYTNCRFWVGRICLLVPYSVGYCPGKCLPWDVCVL